MLFAVIAFYSVLNCSVEEMREKVDVLVYTYIRKRSPLKLSLALGYKGCND
jgi:hypothetical protein